MTTTIYYIQQQPPPTAAVTSSSKKYTICMHQIQAPPPRVIMPTITV